MPPFPSLDLSINLGTVISLLTIVFAAGGFYVFTKNLGKALDAFKIQVDEIKDDLKLLNKVVMDVALSNQRQDNFEKRTDDRFKHVEDDIREMKHGKGFIQTS